MSESLTALYLQNPQLANALRQRAYAQSLAQDATSGEPIRSPWQGVAKLANAGLAALLMNRGDESIQKLMDEQKASDAAGSAAAMALMSPDWGKVPAGQPNADVAAVLQGKQPTATPQLGNALDNVPAAPAVIHINESSGSMQPGITGDGGKAAGPMQVHQAALDDVNKRYGTNYTHQDLINNPEVGKKVGDAYYAILRDQFGGDDQKATAAYNAGPGRVAAAVQAYGPDWMKGIPQATVDYVNRGQQPQPGAAPAQSPQIPGYDPQEVARMQRHSQALLAEGTRLVGSTKTVDQNRGRVMIAQSNHIDNTIQAIQQRAMSYQMRDMKTTVLRDPSDGKNYVYENTPNGPGRKIGLAPTQEAEKNPLGNTGMGQIGATLNTLAPKVINGTATPQEIETFRMGVDMWTNGQRDPVTGALTPGLPITPQMKAAMEKIQGPATQPQAQPQQPGAAPENPMAQAPAMTQTPTGSFRVTQGPQTTTQGMEAYRKAEVETGKVKDAINNFRDALKDAGGTGFSTLLNNPMDPKTVRIMTAYSNMVSALRGEAFLNTGVLQPHELKMLNENLMNPSTVRGAMASMSSYEAMFKELNKFINSGLARQRALANLPPEKKEPAPTMPAPPPGFKVVN